MKNVLFFTLCLLGMAYTSKAQVGIGTTTPHASAQLQIDATNRGLLAPRLSLTQRNSISSPATGLLIYQTDNTPGFYYYDGSAWQAVSADALPAGTTGQTLRHDGTDWVANSLIYNNGTNVGINTATPNSMLDVQGSIGLGVTTVTAATTLNNTHNVVLCNNGPYTVTLPAAASCTGRVIYIKNIDADAELITIDGNSNETIDGYATIVLNLKNHPIRIISDGSNWQILEESYENNGRIAGRNCDGSIMTWNDVTNPTTGATWMDRNLGAARAATSSTDADSYGDYYQWGRLADGHQCSSSGTTTTLSTTDVPGHGDFIIGSGNPVNWQTSLNTDLWQGVNGGNNPCPSGYRLPTQTELNTERTSWSTNNSAGAFSSPLRWSLAGLRRETGAWQGIGSQGWYASSTIGTQNGNIYIFTTASGTWIAHTGAAQTIRCIKN